MERSWADLLLAILSSSVLASFITYTIPRYMERRKIHAEANGLREQASRVSISTATEVIRQLREHIAWQERRIAELEGRVEALEAENRALRERVAALERERA